jgi:hypothetical protein
MKYTRSAHPQVSLSTYAKFQLSWFLDLERCETFMLYCENWNWMESVQIEIMY